MSHDQLFNIAGFQNYDCNTYTKFEISRGVGAHIGSPDWTWSPTFQWIDDISANFVNFILNFYSTLGIYFS